MISPKLIFQCSSASFLAATVLAAPMWVPGLDGTSDNPLTGDYDQRAHNEQRIEVEPVRTQHVLRAAEPEDTGIIRTHHRARIEKSRSIADRNQAAQQVLGELEHTLERRVRTRQVDVGPRIIRCSKEDMIDILPDSD